MRLAWLTDLHLDHASAAERERLVHDIQEAGPAAVLLGGDTATSASLGWHLRTFRDRVGVPVYFVLGNHDCYGSSILETRDLARRLTESGEGLTWLGAVDVIRLTDRSALIGHDGWGDAGFGNPASPIVLNDFLLIEELRVPGRDRLLRALKLLGEEARAHFTRVAGIAADEHEYIIALTHVPPFQQAAWHEGAGSDADWLPFFACRAAGEALRDVMRGHPEKRMTVLCGHTHSGGRYEALRNLEVLTGAAVYGDPRVQRIIEVP